MQNRFPVDLQYHSGYVDDVDAEGKARETRARRAAQRQGYQLEKNPRRDSRAIGFGAWRITDARSGDVVASFGWDERPGTADHLADAESWLHGGEH